MRAVIFSDAHPDWRTRGFERADDVVEQIARVSRHAAHVEADALIFAGDMVEGHDPDERVYTIIRRVRTALDCFPGPKILIPGNHDVVDVAGCRSSLAALEGAGVTVLEDVQMVTLEGAAGPPVTLLAMPHVSKAAVGPVQEYVDQRVDALLDAHYERWRVDRPILAVSHYEVPGAQGGGEEEMRAGDQIVLPDHVRRARSVHTVINGHIHRQQDVLRYPEAADPEILGSKSSPERVAGWDPYVHIPGSLERLTFGEEDEPKGFVVVEI